MILAFDADVGAEAEADGGAGAGGGLKDLVVARLLWLLVRIVLLH